MKNLIHSNLFFLIPIIAAVILIVFVLSFGLKDADTVVLQFFFSLLNTVTIWLGCIFIVKYLWVKYPWEHDPVKHLLIEVVLITSYTILMSGLIYYLFCTFWQTPVVNQIGASVALTMLITFLITAIHESIFFYRQWKLHFSKSVRLERDNMEARYEALRNQINPHFLFNALNGLTSLVEENKKAVAYISNLSDLLRYMLKSGEKELVLLRDEIAVLNNYLSLQKMRFGENLMLEIEVDERFFHYAVPPLSLQMLVENAIKHNIITQKNPLNIQIGVANESIFVQNNMQKISTNDSTGKGLENIKGRYKLFTTKVPEVEDNNSIFKVTLPLLKVEI